MKRKCLQSRCSFNLENEQTMGLGALSCPSCAVCAASSNVVNQECQTCLDCEGEEGELRNNKGKGIKQSIVMEVKQYEQ